MPDAEVPLTRYKAGAECKWCHEKVILEQFLPYDFGVEVTWRHLEDPMTLHLAFTYGGEEVAFTDHRCMMKTQPQVQKAEWPEEFVEAVARALAAEFKFIGGGQIDAHRDTWIKAAAGVLDKLLVELKVDEAEGGINVYELIVLDMILRTTGLSDDLTAAEKLNLLIDQRNLYGELAKDSGTALEQIVKVKGLNETARMRDIASSALLKGKERLQGG